MKKTTIAFISIMLAFMFSTFTRSYHCSAPGYPTKYQHDFKMIYHHGHKLKKGEPLKLFLLRQNRNLRPPEQRKILKERLNRIEIILNQLDNKKEYKEEALANLQFRLRVLKHKMEQE